MTDINDINIRLIDSTMLLVFLRTMRHKKATAVAKGNGVNTTSCQPRIKATSNSI